MSNLFWDVVSCSLQPLMVTPHRHGQCGCDYDCGDSAPHTHQTPVTRVDRNKVQVVVEGALRDVETTVNFFGDTEPENLKVTPLRNVEKDHIINGAFVYNSKEHTAVLRIRVFEGSPPGLYVGSLYNSSRDQACGSVSLCVKEASGQ